MRMSLQRQQFLHKPNLRNLPISCGRFAGDSRVRMINESARRAKEAIGYWFAH